MVMQARGRRHQLPPKRVDEDLVLGDVGQVTQECEGLRVNCNLTCTKLGLALFNLIS